MDKVITTRLKAFQEDVSMLLHIIILIMIHHFKYPNWLVITMFVFTMCQILAYGYRERLANKAFKESK